MKSLSNIIKSNYIYVDRDEKKVIDSDLKAKMFYPEIFESNREEMAATGEFVAGLYAVPVEEQLISVNEEAEKELTADEADALVENIIETAQKEAQEIIENAKREAEVFAYQLEEEARKRGYNEGIGNGNQEIAKKLEEIKQREEQLEQDYQEKISQLEPAFAELTAALLEKLTGVVMKERKEVIIHLMEHSLRQLGKVKMVSIMVSSMDFAFVNERREEIANLLTYPCEITVIEDETLSKGQCILEADNSMIDCSLDTQLTGLIEDLKMLVDE